MGGQGPMLLICDQGPLPLHHDTAAVLVSGLFIKFLRLVAQISRLGHQLIKGLASLKDSLDLWKVSIGTQDLGRNGAGSGTVWCKIILVLSSSCWIFMILSAFSGLSYFSIHCLSGVDNGYPSSVGEGSTAARGYFVRNSSVILERSW